MGNRKLGFDIVLYSLRKNGYFYLIYIFIENGDLYCVRENVMRIKRYFIYLIYKIK